MNEISIGKHQISLRSRPLICSEIGINHNGNVEDAEALIRMSAEAGADLVKLQTHIVDAEMLPSGPTADYVGEGFYDLIKRCQLTYDDHLRLQRLSDSLGITFFSTPFSKEAVEWLDRLGVPAFKFGSGELTNIPLLRHAARKGKPLILSTGMSTLGEVRDTVEAIWSINQQIILTNCASVYPANYSDIRLLGIQQLREIVPLVGQSDHSQGIATALGAVALGAIYIEKHTGIDRNWPGPDQKASILPDELKRLVVESRQIWEAMQERGPVLEGERPVAAMAHHSVVTIAPMKAGDPFTLDNLWVKRPGNGIPASAYDSILGRIAKRDIDANLLLKEEWIA